MGLLFTCFVVYLFGVWSFTVHDFKRVKADKTKLVDLLKRITDRLTCSQCTCCGTRSLSGKHSFVKIPTESKLEELADHKCRLERVESLHLQPRHTNSFNSFPLTFNFLFATTLAGKTHHKSWLITRSQRKTTSPLHRHQKVSRNSIRDGNGCPPGFQGLLND